MRTVQSGASLGQVGGATHPEVVDLLVSSGVPRASVAHLRKCLVGVRQPLSP